jgi:hypothetical protein
MIIISTYGGFAPFSAAFKAFRHSQFPLYIAFGLRVLLVNRDGRGQGLADVFAAGPAAVFQ